MSGGRQLRVVKTPTTVDISLDRKLKSLTRLIESKINYNFENGPTIVGDDTSDPTLMASINAEKIKALGNNFYEYKSPDCPRVVLDKLEQQGYRIIGMAGIGQTCIWTLHKEPEF